MDRYSIRLFFVVISIITIWSCAGCADLQGALAQTGAWRDDAAALRDQIDGRLADLRTQRQQIPDGSPQAALADAAIDAGVAKVSALDAAIAQADLVIAEAQHPTDALTRIARGVSPWVPAPAQGPLVLGAALVATFLRSRQLKTGAASIIESLEHVMRRDERFRDIFASHADTIRTIQTPAARRLVDRTVGTRA